MGAEAVGSAGPMLAQQEQPGNSERAQSSQKYHETTLSTALCLFAFYFRKPSVISSRIPRGRQ